MIEDQRPNYIDYGKTIGMLLVIVGHYAGCVGIHYDNRFCWAIVHFLGLFHVPFFFFLSGLLHKQVSLLQTEVKVVKSLVIPYFLWSFVGCFVWVFLSISCGDFHFKSFLKYLAGILTAGDCCGLGYNWELLTSPLWFCVALAWIKFFIGIMGIGKMTLFWSVVGGIVCLYMGNILPFRLDSSVVGLFFYLLGFSLKDFIFRLIHMEIFKRVCIFFISLMVLFACWYFNVESAKPVFPSIQAMTFGKYPFIYAFSGFFGTIMLIILCSFMTMKWHFVVLVANGTIVFLGAQKIVFRLIGHWGNDGTISSMVGTSIGVFLICSGVTMMCSKFAPCFLGFRSLENKV